MSITTSASKPNGGQFVLHAKALHGNPFDGHTLGPVITELERLTGVRMDHVVLTDTLELENLDYNEFEASFDSITLALASHLGALAPYRER